MNTIMIKTWSSKSSQNILPLRDSSVKVDKVFDRVH
jgi:hypothetical protein